MPYKDPIKRKEYQRKWGRKIEQSGLTTDAKYYRKHRKKRLLQAAIRRNEYLTEWEGFIPKVYNCEICGKEIYFHNKDITKAIHFDHRHEGEESIKTSPFSFLQTHKRTPALEKIWVECDFGKLCTKCNKLMPTLHRKEWLEKVNKYING